MKLGLLGLVACAAPAVVAPPQPPSTPAPAPAVAAPVDPALAPLIAQIGPHLRGVAKLDLANDKRLNELFAAFTPSDSPACRVVLRSARVAMGEPLRVAAEIDGDVDVARLTCLLGKATLARMTTGVGLALSDRPGGIALTRDLAAGHADGALAQRCIGNSCLAVELGPADHHIHVAATLTQPVSTFRIDGAHFDALVAAANADPQFTQLHLRLDGAALVGDLPAAASKELEQELLHLLESLRIPSSSMRPTLIPGDHLIALKGSLLGKLTAGDLVVYRVDGKYDYVKRVVAFAGQTVVETANGIAIDGAPLPTLVLDPQFHFSDEDRRTQALVERSGALVRESIGKRSYLTVRTAPARADHRWDVPEGTLFVLGDNRNNANDSRDAGPIPVADVRARVVAIWLSWHDGAPDWNRMGPLPD